MAKQGIEDLGQVPTQIVHLRSIQSNLACEKPNRIQLLTIQFQLTQSSKGDIQSKIFIFK